MPLGGAYKSLLFMIVSVLFPAALFSHFLVEIVSQQIRVVLVNSKCASFKNSSWLLATLKIKQSSKLSAKMCRTVNKQRTFGMGNWHDPEQKYASKDLGEIIHSLQPISAKSTFKYLRAQFFGSFHCFLRAFLMVCSSNCRRGFLSRGFLRGFLRGRLTALLSTGS